MNPKISIITICYNAEKYIESAIKSFQTQDYLNKEYIIIDGKSTDSTINILNTYNDLFDVVISEPDNGLYDALNKGINLASGDVIGILHADDLFFNEKTLSSVANHFNQNQVDALYGDLQYVLSDGKTKYRRWISGPYKKNLFRKGWMPPHPTFYVKKEVFQKYGLYNTKFKLAADYELMLRFIEKNKIKVTYLPQFLSLMRVGGASNASLKNRLTANKEDYLAWKINGLNPPFGLRIIKPLRKIFQFI